LPVPTVPNAQARESTNPVESGERSGSFQISCLSNLSIDLPVAVPPAEDPTSPLPSLLLKLLVLPVRGIRMKTGVPVILAKSDISPSVCCVLISGKGRSYHTHNRILGHGFCRDKLITNRTRRNLRIPCMRRPKAPLLVMMSSQVCRADSYKKRHRPCDGDKSRTMAPLGSAAYNPTLAATGHCRRWH